MSIDCESATAGLFNSYAGGQMRTTIVIASYNDGDLLHRTVNACVEASSTLDADIVIADDASDDRSVEALKAGFPRLEVRRHSSRLGASPTKALGASAARGDVLIFLDGHTKPERDALARLADTVTKVSSDAIVTPRLLALDPERWRNDGAAAGHGYRLDLLTLDCGWSSLADLRPMRVNGRVLYESPALIGCAFAVSRELYDRLWGFDQDMHSWGVEDLDFGLKSWLMGYPVLHDPAATVGHRFRDAFDSYDPTPRPVRGSLARSACQRSAGRSSPSKSRSPSDSIVRGICQENHLA